MILVHQYVGGLLWIPFLLLNTVTISLKSNVLPSKENMYPCFRKILMIVL